MNRGAAQADEPHESAMHDMLHLAVDMCSVIRIKSPSVAKQFETEVTRVYLDWRAAVMVENSKKLGKMSGE